MALDLRGFYSEPNQWAGLYKTADMVEKRKLRQDQLALQQQARRNQSAAFLQNYLDPKDYLSGTAYDPLILQGLDSAMKTGSQLAASGADNASLLMALGPMVNKLSSYSTNAKTINKQVDEQIKLMKDTGLIGYDFGKLKEEALNNAFYQQDANGQRQLNPDQADASVNWVAKAIENSPEKVTTGLGWDEFANKAKMSSDISNVTDYDRFGNMDRNKVNLKFQNYMIPERQGNKITGFVPKYDLMVDEGKPLMHTFTDASGKPSKEQVRVLDEKIFDALPPGLLDNIRGQVKQHINEYQTQGGEPISINSPKAKLAARALAYKELNRPQRNFGAIENTSVIDKPSPQIININTQATDQYKKNLEENTAIRTAARMRITNQFKSNPVQVLDKIVAGDNYYLQGDHVPVNGQDVIEITPSLPGGGLKAGRGQTFKYRKMYYNPSTKTFLVEKETKDKYGLSKTEVKEIPPNELEKFKYEISEANGLKYNPTKKSTNNEPDKALDDDFDKRSKSRNAILNPFGGG